MVLNTFIIKYQFLEGKQTDDRTRHHTHCAHCDIKYDRTLGTCFTQLGILKYCNPVCQIILHIKIVYFVCNKIFT